MAVQPSPPRPSPGLPDWGSAALQGDDLHDGRLQEILDGHAEEAVAPGPHGRRLALAGVVEVQHRLVREALVRSGDGAALAAFDLAVEAKLLEEDLAERTLQRRIGALVDLQEALAGLRRADSVATILRMGPQALARSCGFDRANLFKVQDGRMVMEAAYWHGDPEGAQEMLVWAREHPPRLDHMLLETEMIRRRGPCLVLDAPNDPQVPRALADFARTRSYVAAPIMPAGKVIGFVHADCLYAGRRCDSVDRDLVWAFAEGFGYAFERTVLVERLHRHRDATKTALLAAAGAVDDLTEGELRLSHADPGGAASSRTAVGGLFEHVAPLEAALTRREVEVLRLMATGMTNKAIAEELVITPGTVKAHVKHVLRKVRAANRSEAVARYLRSVRQQELRAGQGEA